MARKNLSTLYYTQVARTEQNGYYFYYYYCSHILLLLDDICRMCFSELDPIGQMHTQGKTFGWMAFPNYIIKMRTNNKQQIEKH